MQIFSAKKTKSKWNAKKNGQQSKGDLKKNEMKAKFKKWRWKSEIDLLGIFLNNNEEMSAKAQKRHLSLEIKKTTTITTAKMKKDKREKHWFINDRWGEMTEKWKNKRYSSQEKAFFFHQSSIAFHTKMPSFFNFFSNSFPECGKSM